MYTPAAGGQYNDGPRAALERGLYGSDGSDLCGVGRERSEATQLLKKLLVENGCLCLAANLRERGCAGVGEGDSYQRAQSQM